MITCNECGKTNGEGDIGEHWICDSCKVPEPQEDQKASKSEEEQQKKRS